jgi:hypothetical protein
MMSLRLLLSIWLAAAAVRAEGTWAVEPGQALLTVDGPPFSAFSHRVTGRLLEQEDGAVRVELRMPLESLVTGSVSQARRVPRDGELLFELVGTGAATDGSLELEGTLTIRGVTQPVRITLVLARLNAMTFGHAAIVVHLRDFGFPLPAGMRDTARIEVDTGLRLEHALASSG